MRIGTNMMYDRALSAMLDREREVSKTQQQLATGRRILSPQDDPAGSVRVLDLTQHIDTLTQHQTNLQRARSRLELEDASLAGAVNLVQRARELAVQGANDPLAQSDRTALAYEIEQLRDELLGLANTRDANGDFLFGGYQGSAIPTAVEENPVGSGIYVYNGDLGQRLIRISHDRQIAEGDNGFEVFFDIGTRLDVDGDGTQDGAGDAFSTLNLLAEALKGTAFPAPPSGNTYEDAGRISNYIGELDAILANFTDTQAKVGARLNTLDQQSMVNEDLMVSMQGTRSKDQDLDYASAITQYQQQMNALDAAQKSFMKMQDLSLFKYI